MKEIQKVAINCPSCGNPMEIEKEESPSRYRGQCKKCDAITVTVVVRRGNVDKKAEPQPIKKSKERKNEPKNAESRKVRKKKT